ncbi:hypothetical protein SAMD00019534_085010 [Acytostelium subglobosum LB1]|uniref:hypothetical protein n=1 Tax=Acytostelium subglobosum LB1 TaxID=1410327 RepID=UPI000644FF60|nr:hypothetical protein SAMD00019534_085010 [Acytostelium subglobosum LB1]GAM25326.1 hypothetical protein SAMD00019534_085010 [Acytostelium subglobosum LB1]|eukprot:XP_012751846.1 hypothetical protein SAMD00019534_085010 [Acytostelium subglobosum LB1]
MLPYTDVPIQRRLFSNCEKARTWYSHLNNYPGLFGAAANSSEKYVTSIGVPPLAQSKLQQSGFYTPYGAFPVILANHSVGLVWYNNMLRGPAMQGPYGSNESGDNDGKATSNNVSWDTKQTTVVAILGGIGKIVREALKEDCKYQMFYDRIDASYSKQFPKLLGEEIPFALPSVTAPHNVGREDFTLCQSK